MDNTGITNILQKVDYSINLVSLTFSIIISFILSYILSRFYEKQANTLSNPASLARIMPILSITTTIIISVVKSSLALSLGLVGALSIVRFRTPIKEPEELTYIFLCIAIGLSTGAEQHKAAFLGLSLTIFLIYFSKLLARKNNKENLIRINISGLIISDVDKILEILAKNTQRVDFQNMTINSLNSERDTNLTLLLVPNNFSSIKLIANEISKNFNSANLTIVSGNY